MNKTHTYPKSESSIETHAKEWKTLNEPDDMFSLLPMKSSIIGKLHLVDYGTCNIDHLDRLEITYNSKIIRQNI